MYSITNQSRQVLSVPIVKQGQVSYMDLALSGFDSHVRTEVILPSVLGMQTMGLLRIVEVKLPSNAKTSKQQVKNENE